MASYVSTTQQPAGLEKSRWRKSALTAIVWWATAWLATLATYPFTNDHFGRISAARQIARYGERPFRDFLDPGYVLTELVSAGMQWLFGDHLLGEMLWTSAFIATGALLVIVLTRRIAPSPVATVVVGILVILGAPRPYDFDKVLFYPLGVLLCWRYADRPDARRLWMLALCAAVAGMFRYDNGLFILAAALVAVIARDMHDRRSAVRRALLLIGASAACAAPYVLFLAFNGGVANAANQMITYARREGGRTRLTALPSPVPSELRLVYHPDHVLVRWMPSADPDRPRLESQYTLHHGVRRGNEAARTWVYEIDDISRDNLRALISDPQVVDTHLIDRRTATLIREETRWIQLYRQVPVIGKWSVSWTSEDASNTLYWVFVLIPLGALLMLWGRSDPVERTYVLSTVAMSACVVGLILREPLVARMSGAAAPTIILSLWVWRHVHRGWSARIIATAVVITIAVVAGWRTTVTRLSQNIPALYDTLTQVAQSPPSSRFLPSSQVRGAIGYVRRCTRPEDRVFAGWFVPELYFFSQRAFAGGMVVTFGHHWSESANQRRIIEKLASESVPLVILPDENHDFQETYVELNAYFQRHYRSAGSTTFGPAGPAYTVLTANGRAATGTDAVSGLPCFASQNSEPNLNTN